MKFSSPTPSSSSSPISIQVFDGYLDITQCHGLPVAATIAALEAAGWEVDKFRGDGFRVFFQNPADVDSLCKEIREALEA